ncbi:MULTISPECIES: hypothetical protein [unclassified Sporosarcina]|uniref:hypothetical protein n=1 Tax=unclassified Sporosarcina TaxID=2647733 RepID=UPI000C1642A0|nr:MULTISPECIES: hypothetical protein [unclassified Sporosarcina]PID04047.1 hypothetical protein CSV67_00805 [Sporosarcina sp. P2]PID25039.1 hypothetical protein CSV60_07235 [Sporosarcina sp. P7]
MGTASVQTSIAIIFISLCVGFLSFYFIGDLSKKKKKIYIGELVSQITNFVLFMWLGKILLNLSVFLKDPLAILAYPSNSNAVYIAVLFSFFAIAIKSKRQKIDIIPFLNAFIHVFLITSFLYEFIQIVWNNNTYSIRYLGLLAVLIITFVVMHARVTIYRLNIIMAIGWTLGTFGLTFVMPFMMVFGYTMAPWFLGLIFVICLIVIILKKEEGVVNGRN